MIPKISVLVAARKNSKYLAKFLAGANLRTHNRQQTEFLVMLNEHDTWNDELVYHEEKNGIQFFRENMELGRAGLHEYFNELYKHATGDWIVYFCEDHFITMDGWDNYLRSFINGTLEIRGIEEQALKNKKGPLNPKEVWCIVPKFDNCGSMNQVLSRGYIEAIGGVLGRHGWIDSYVNHLNHHAFGDVVDALRDPARNRVFLLDDNMFHDFTHDKPNPMSDAHMQSVVGIKGRALPKYDSPEVKELIRQDSAKLRAAVQGDLA